MQSRVTPYVVQVDKFGAVQAVGPAIQNYMPTDAEIAWYLARFITDVRSLVVDPVVVRKNWLEAYDYATDHGAVSTNSRKRTIRSKRSASAPSRSRSPASCASPTIRFR